MKPKPISTSEAPAAIGAYSQAMLVRGLSVSPLLFTSGQVALVDASNVFHCGSNVDQGERYIFLFCVSRQNNFG